MTGINHKNKGDMMSTGYWGTESEIKYLSKIGEWGINPKDRKQIKSMLGRYIECGKVRDWGKIDGDAALSFAYQKMLSL